MTRNDKAAMDSKNPKIKPEEAARSPFSSAFRGEGRHSTSKDSFKLLRTQQNLQSVASNSSGLEIPEEYNRASHGFELKRKKWGLTRRDRERLEVYTSFVEASGSDSEYFGFPSSGEASTRFPCGVNPSVPNWKMGVLCIWSLMVAMIIFGSAVLISWSVRSQLGDDECICSRMAHLKCTSFLVTPNSPHRAGGDAHAAIIWIGMSFCIAVVSTCLCAMWHLADRMERQMASLLTDLQDARMKADGAAQSKTEFLANVSHFVRTPLNGMIGMLGALESLGPLTLDQRESIETALLSCWALGDWIGSFVYGELGLRTSYPPAEDRSFSEASKSNSAPQGDDLVNVSTSEDKVLTYLDCERPSRKSTWVNEVVSGFKSTSPKKSTGVNQESSAEVSANQDVPPGTMEVQAEVQEVPPGESLLVCCSLRRAKSLNPTPFLNAYASSFVGKKCLVVDDNLVNRKVLGARLAPLGIQVEYAENGQVAVQKLQPIGSHGFAWVFMDLQMPVMDGYEATQNIRLMEARSSDEGKTLLKVPIFAVTADIVSGVEEKCRLAGMDGFLTKPLSRERVKEALSQGMIFKL